MELEKQKNVFMYQENGKYVTEFKTLREACLFLINNNHVESDKKPTQMKSNISKSIKNNWCAYGFRWSYDKKLSLI